MLVSLRFVLQVMESRRFRTTTNVFNYVSHETLFYNWRYFTYGTSLHFRCSVIRLWKGKTFSLPCDLSLKRKTVFVAVGVVFGKQKGFRYGVICLRKGKMFSLPCHYSRKK